tara:strand:- start:134 stop:1066 length:933 start_codon:yes stop_codon:yes gene_type:complete
MRIIKETKIEFMNQRKIGFILSGTVLIAGLLSLLINQGPKLSIDFKGGTLVSVQYNSFIEISDVKNSLKSFSIDGKNFDFSNEEVKYFGSQSAISVRIPLIENPPDNFAQNIVDHLYNSFPNKISDDRNTFVLNKGSVGPKIGAELSGKAVMAILSSLFLILLYISFRFEFKFALGAIAALTHDVLITLGIFSIMRYEISLPVIAAFLTIVGYSLNDTIVIFDRIRENIKSSNKTNYDSIINRSINESLSRTLVTSLTTFFVVFILWFFGGEVINTFAFAMIVGVIIGTYSSIYVASPIVLLLNEKYPSR